MVDKIGLVGGLPASGMDHCGQWQSIDAICNQLLNEGERMLA
jgi:hypothetical protein